MSGYLEQFNNLRPGERRFVVVVGIALFVVMNIFLVVPHFGDLGAAQARYNAAQADINKFNKEISKKSYYEAQIAKLGADAGNIELEDQAVHFDRAYHECAAQNGVIILGSSRVNVKTNEFFIEQEVSINTQSSEQELVNFLYNLGASSSMMRVRAISLRPDQSHMKLSANLTIVASYQKKPSAKAAAITPVKSVAPAAPTIKTAPAVAPAKPAPPFTPGGLPGLPRRTVPPNGSPGLVPPMPRHT